MVTGIIAQDLKITQLTTQIGLKKDTKKVNQQLPMTEETTPPQGEKIAQISAIVPATIAYTLWNDKNLDYPATSLG